MNDTERTPVPLATVASYLESVIPISRPVALLLAAARRSKKATSSPTVVSRFSNSVANDRNAAVSLSDERG
ncbi:hypothetical protein ACFQJD_18080 [Haloplanus sp. GCM10025708]|uniref:hypothetical protein n=1 Tax=Haloplanus sp. GCM10025708 TaxID=3252679 RepID=UPI003613CFF1